jgi:hypothetical protein
MEDYAVASAEVWRAAKASHPRSKYPYSYPE